MGVRSWPVFSMSVWICSYHASAPLPPRGGGVGAEAAPPRSQQLRFGQTSVKTNGMMSITLYGEAIENERCRGREVPFLPLSESRMLSENIGLGVNFTTKSALGILPAVRRHHLDGLPV